MVRGFDEDVLLFGGAADPLFPYTLAHRPIECMPLGDHAFPDMHFTASNTPQCPPPGVRQPVESAGPDMPFTASSTVQCPEYTPPASKLSRQPIPIP